MYILEIGVLKMLITEDCIVGMLESATLKMTEDVAGTLLNGTEVIDNSKMMRDREIEGIGRGLVVLQLGIDDTEDNAETSA